MEVWTARRTCYRRCRNARFHRALCVQVPDLVNRATAAATAHFQPSNLLQARVMYQGVVVALPLPVVWIASRLARSDRNQALSATRMDPVAVMLRACAMPLKRRGIGMDPLAKNALTDGQVSIALSLVRETVQALSVTSLAIAQLTAGVIAFWDSAGPPVRRLTAQHVQSTLPPEI